MLKKTLPFTAVIGISAFAGNMINTGLSYGLHWKSLGPIDFMETFAIDFPLLLLPTIATLLPAFLSLVALFFMSEKKSLVRKYWLYALVNLLVINVFTAVYFLPLNLDFVTQEIELEKVDGLLNSWLIFHWLRIGVAILAGVFAVKAFKENNEE